MCECMDKTTAKSLTLKGNITCGQHSNSLISNESQTPREQATTTTKTIKKQHNTINVLAYKNKAKNKRKVSRRRRNIKYTQK